MTLNSAALQLKQLLLVELEQVRHSKLQAEQIDTPTSKYPILQGQDRLVRTLKSVDEQTVQLLLRLTLEHWRQV